MGGNWEGQYAHLLSSDGVRLFVRYAVLGSKGIITNDDVIIQQPTSNKQQAISNEQQRD